MGTPEQEELATVFIEQRDETLPSVYVSFGAPLDKLIWVDVVEGKLRLTTQARLVSSLLRVYEEAHGAADRGALSEVFQAANGLVDQINPFVQPIMEFVRKIQEATSDPYIAGSQPVIGPVQIQGWLVGPAGPHVDIYIAHMGMHSGWLSISGWQRRENDFIFDAGLNLFLRATDYEQETARILADAQPLLASAREFSRSMERFMPPVADD